MQQVRSLGGFDIGASSYKFGPVCAISLVNVGEPTGIEVMVLCRSTSKKNARVTESRTTVQIARQDGQTVENNPDSIQSLEEILGLPIRSAPEV